MLGLPTCTHRHHPPCTLKSSSVASPSLFNSFVFAIVKQHADLRMTVHTHMTVRAHWPNGRTVVEKYVHLLGWATVVVRVKPRIYKRSVHTHVLLCVRTLHEFPSSPTYTGNYSRRMNYASNNLLYGCVQSYAVRSNTTYTYLCRSGRGSRLRETHILHASIPYSDATCSARSSVDPNRRVVHFSFSRPSY